VLSIHVEGGPALHGRQRAEGSRLEPTRSRERINANVVGPRFFSTLGIPFITGRDFSDQDVDDRPPVVIVNETAARMHFPDGDPVGRRIRRRSTSRRSCERCEWEMRVIRCAAR
jgi:putative ABC transport system permease protein